MASNAYDAWIMTSLEHLDELEQLHKDARGSAPGRRWGTRQFNMSLFVALVAQFQMYCRNLHDEAVDVHRRHANQHQAGLIDTLLTQGRKLDLGTPRTDTLGSDFGRLGLPLIATLKAVDHKHREALRRLDLLVDFRNAIGHGNETEIAKILSAGDISATLSSFRAYRRDVDGLVTTMDSAVASGLAHILQIQPPW